jgi:pyridoxamine 5'-phosphate oxidase
VIASRQWLDDNYTKLAAEMKSTSVNRPPYWGGYIVKPVIVEFWQGRISRLHDRIQYSFTEAGDWKIERLAP